MDERARAAVRRPLADSPARGRAAVGDAPRGDTRERIQAVALELFAEQGYDKTSLREIAERLGVTKAALYYHFHSKEDIVRSFTREYTADLDALIAWGSEQPATPQSRAAILARYADIVMARLGVIRFMEQNQAALHTLMGDGEQRKKMFREQFSKLRGVIVAPGAPLRDRVRATMAITSIGLGCLIFQSETASPEELRGVLLDLACELAGAEPVSPPSR